MDIEKVRKLLAQGRIALRFADHAIIEGRKDGLTTEDLETTVANGQVIEDYGAHFSCTSQQAIGYLATSC